MKQLLLVRHAKSDWDHSGLADHDRPLNERGRRDAPRMAAALRRRGVVPDLVLTSTAARAETTALALAAGLGFPVERVVKLAGLYLAPPQVILRVVQGLDETAGTALVVGHNPGMHEAANLLGNGAAEHFPTLAVARFELDTAYWGGIEWGGGRLVELLVPRGIEEG